MNDASTPAAPVRLKIRGLAHGGDGVGEPLDGEGPVWFVPGTWTDDVVEATEEHRAARFVRGRLHAVVEPSPARVEPPCPLADRCGGCTWQHVQPSAQGAAKRTVVAEQLRKLVPDSKVTLAFEGPPQGYRRRARMHYAKQPDGSLKLGFLAPHSHEVVDAQRCPVLVPALDEGMQRVRTLAEILGDQGEVWGLTDGQQVLLGLPRVRPSDAVEAVATAALDDRVVGIEVRGGRSRAAYGRRRLDIDGGAGLVPLRVGAFSFTQAQAAGGRALVKHVAQRAQASGLRVLELFAGSGNFTRALAKHASRVWASDTDRDAVEALRHLAQVSGLPINAKKQSAGGLLPKLEASKQQYDVAVLDPPRAGLGKDPMASLCRVASQRIVYVSCDPATLGRDLAVATDLGFEIAEVAVFDLMPMTSQVEVVATLHRQGGKR